MKATFVDRFKAIFRSDPKQYWWEFFSDEERELRRMDIWELAGEVEAGDNRRRIVAEHMLNVRLVRIQSNAAWGAGILGFIGALLGAALSVALTITLLGN